MDKQAILALAAKMRKDADFAAKDDGGVLYTRVAKYADELSALAAAMAETEPVGRQFRWRAPGRNWSAWQEVGEGETDAAVLADVRKPAYWNMLDDKAAEKAECEFRNVYASPASRDAAPVVGEVAVKVAGEAARWRHKAEAYMEAVFDGNAVFAALSHRAQGRTSPENVSDTLDACARVAKAALATRGQGEEAKG